MRSRIAGAAIGLVFGITLCWSGMSSPDVIRGALLFEHSYLFLFFASAVGTAALGLALLRRRERRALLIDTPLVKRAVRDRLGSRRCVPGADRDPDRTRHRVVGVHPRGHGRRGLSVPAPVVARNRACSRCQDGRKPGDQSRRRLTDRERLSDEEDPWRSELGCRLPVWL